MPVKSTKTKTSKPAYTKRAKKESKVVSDDTIKTSNAVEETNISTTAQYVEVNTGKRLHTNPENIEVEPSDNLEDAIAEIWDAFVLRNVLNPKVFGDREIAIFKKYKDIANSILAQRKVEATLDQEMVERV